MDIDKLLLSDEHYAALGKIAVKMSYLEDCLRNLIGAIINQNHTQFGMIITKDMGVGKMTDMFPHLVKYTFGAGKRFDACIKFNNNVIALNTERNVFIHSVYEEGPFIEKAERKKLKIAANDLSYVTEPLENVTVERLNDLVRKISAAITDCLKMQIAFSSRKV